ncbi:LysR family transcriptional regulator [Peribacillus butanolivorans]|uniref:LysR family transcriptional regulator n=1 Tax=Peribacillus butanolivorans TaxID=421767 RepID=UPI00382A67C2
MDLRLLEYFLAICEEMHFTKAAEKLGISQPTLSQQIRILESNIGTPLFHRVGKKIFMTEAGQILIQRAQRIFSELNQVRNEINELKDLQRGKITIGSSGNHLLLSSIISFHKQYPGIELSIIDSTTDETIKRVLNNQFDIGIVFLPIKEKQIESKRLFSEEFPLIVSAEHEFANKPFVKLEDLQSTPIFLLQKKYSIRQDIDNNCRLAGFTLKPVVELSDMQSLLQMTLINKGITILPKSYLVNIDDHRVRQIPIIDSFPKKEVGIIYQKDTFRSSTIKTFIEHLLENYKA